MTLRFTGLNLTNKGALYNFLSTFSGTHFVSPHALQAQVGVTFQPGGLLITLPRQGKAAAAPLCCRRSNGCATSVVPSHSGV
jgi:hypothetical protein